MEEGAKTKGTRILSDAIVLALLPGFAYFLTFMFLVGYSVRLGIPPAFIEPDLKSVISVLCSLVVFTVVIAIFLDSIILMFPEKFHDPYILIYALIGILLLLAVYEAIFSHFTWVTVVIFGIGVLSGVLTGVFRFRVRSKRASIPEFISQLPGARVLFPSGANQLTVAGVFVFIMSPFFATTFGHFTASRETWFFTFGNNPEYVVVAAFGGNFVAAPLDRKTKHFAPNFSVREFGKGPPLELHWEKIGPLWPTSCPVCD